MEAVIKLARQVGFSAANRNIASNAIVSIVWKLVNRSGKISLPDNCHSTETHSARCRLPITQLGVRHMRTF